MKSITMQEFMQLKGVKVVDVRESDEHATGVIEGALLAPLSQFNQYLSNLNKEDTYYIICHAGGRSIQAAQYLDAHGYKVVNVMGGMSAYKGPKV